MAEPTIDELVLTTIDNPFNPKTDYDKWKQWDEDKGHYTTQYVARLILIEDENIDIDDELRVNEVTNKVISDIIEHDVLNIYILV